MSATSFSWGYGISSAPKKKVTEEVVEEPTEKAPTSYEQIEKYDRYVEEHILPEPEQVINSAHDCYEAALSTADVCQPVLGELPDAEPTPHAEWDVVYNEDEREVIKETVTETKVKAVSVKPAKKKPGRKKKAQA